jgi:phosphate transport system permease protein
MIWFFLLVVIALSALAFIGGRGLAARRAAAKGVKSHSRPAQHGLYALIWVGAPSLLVLILAGVFADGIAHQALVAGASPQVEQLEPFRREAFFSDAYLVGAGQPAQQIWPAPLAEQLTVQGRRAAEIRTVLSIGTGVAALIAAILGGLFVFSQIRPDLRARNRVEGWIGGLLFACSVVAVLTTIGIVFSLLWDSCASSSRCR